MINRRSLLKALGLAPAAAAVASLPVKWLASGGFVGVPRECIVGEKEMSGSFIYSETWGISSKTPYVEVTAT